jgi:hypothetical protein
MYDDMSKSVERTRVTGGLTHLFSPHAFACLDGEIRKGCATADTNLSTVTNVTSFVLQHERLNPLTTETIPFFLLQPHDDYGVSVTLCY